MTKINLSLCKNNARIQFYDTYSFNTHSKIEIVLLSELEKYYRNKKQISFDVKCTVYKSKSGKYAVVAYDTPRKRLFAKTHTFEEFAEKYGFIPKPVNVLKKYIDLGYVKSETIEHFYHTREIEYEITDDLQTMRDAYSVDFNERDSVCTDFNGFSCMSNSPNVGDFYYYFGASLLIFRDKHTREIVGRGVLWNHEDKKHLYKVYAKVNAQKPANEIRAELIQSGIITVDRLPHDFETVLQRIDNKTPEEILNIIEDTTEVPYVDEFLYLSHNKTKLIRQNGLQLHETHKPKLSEVGLYKCEHCGDYIDEDSVIWVDGECFCSECVRYCEHCNEYHAPDANGDWVGNEWICEDCLNEYYAWCDDCEEYHHSDYVTYVESVGHYVCDDCLYNNYHECEECGEYFPADSIVEINGNHYCTECAENIPVDEETDEQTAPKGE